jgi:DNA topoisomerase-1
MKTIIISEKPIAGQKIAEILSGNKYISKREKGEPIFTFNHSVFGETVLIPLKGHISDVDFPSANTNWYTTNISDLAKNVKILYNEKEKNIIDLLKKESIGAEQTIIATDADREGESIGREAVVYLKLKNPSIKVKRAYFSAITKDELDNAFTSLVDLNYNLADAADARREIDLVWGLH